MRRTITVLALLAGVAGCGGGSGGGVSTASVPSGGGPVPTGTTPVGGTNPAGGGAFVITISNLAFSPLNLTVPPGATVTVVNNDGMPHSVTSEPASGRFTPGAVNGVAFDTGEFSSGQRTFTIPASATAGTVIPYFCVVHRQTMATPNGTITVDPNATASAGSTPSTPTPAPQPATSMPGY